MNSIQISIISILIIISIVRYCYYDHSPVRRQLRHLLDSYIPPIRGEYTDYSNMRHNYQGTTTKNSAKYIIELLKSRDNTVSNILSNITELNRSINYLNELLGSYNNITNTFHNETLVSDIIINTASSIISNNANSYEYVPDEDRRYEDLFDIIIVIPNNITIEEWLNFLNAWKPIIERMFLLLIQLGDPNRFIPIPNWVNYDLFTIDDINRCLGDNVWILNYDNTLNSNANAMKTFGYLIATRDYVYFIDINSRPCYDNNNVIINPLEDHLMNLVTPSTPYYYNIINNPFTPNSDFDRGYPYSLREGIVTAVSIGHTINDISNNSATYSSTYYDSITKLSKLNLNNRLYNKSLQVSYPSQSTTIPYGIFYSFYSNNIAINSILVGPLMYCGNVLINSNDFNMSSSNIDILIGWIHKIIFDTIRSGVKITGNRNIISKYINLSNPLNELANDLKWIEYSEELIRFFSSLKLSLKANESIKNAIYELLDIIEREFIKDHQINDLKLFIQSFRIYCNYWFAMHAFFPKFLPTASRSSIIYNSSNPRLDGYISNYSSTDQSNSTDNYNHHCAVFTIAHNEPIMLPIWIRYYSKHFPNAIFVVDHMHNISSHKSTDLQDIYKPNFQNMNMSGTRGVVYWKLFGDSAGFPVHFLSASAEVYQQKFLRSGYKCVLYTDVDEFVVPNTTIYPNGLKQYIYTFENNPDIIHTRVVAYNLAHVSDSDNGTEYENEINWNKSILSQRNFYHRIGRYDKPLLSKIPLRWKAGFHTVYAPFIDQDQNLFMFHLPEVDKTYCFQREKHKYEVVKTMHRDEASGGFNNHIWQYPTLLKTNKLCPLARSEYKSKSDEAVTANFEKLEKIPDCLKSVDL